MGLKKVLNNILVVCLIMGTVLFTARTGEREAPSSIQDSLEFEGIEATSNDPLEDQPFNLEHARELMGRYYESSAIGKAQKKPGNLRRFIFKQVHSQLAVEHKGLAKRITRALINEGRRYNLDPVFLMAVIKTESRFNPNAIGSVGEIGLMQIRPETGAWLAQKMGLAWPGKSVLHDPRINIRLGAAYINQLRKKFPSQGQLYLSAYNLGTSKLYRRIASNAPVPKIYAQKVMRNYVGIYSVYVQ